MGGLDVLLIAVGTLGDPSRAEADPAHLAAVIEVNFTAVAQLLMRAARRLEARGHGLIVALSSVAGDRGRPSNYPYGAAKAGLSTFLEGLRGRLHGSGVHVCTVKPGPTDTKMTFGMEDPPPLMADPDRVAADIVAAMARRTDVCYTPPLWRYIMAALRLIPARLFKRLDL
jgi:short-subunit dehydrogenase